MNSAALVHRSVRHAWFIADSSRLD